MAYVFATWQRCALLKLNCSTTIRYIIHIWCLSRRNPLPHDTAASCEQTNLAQLQLLVAFDQRLWIQDLDLLKELDKH